LSASTIVPSSTWTICQRRWKYTQFMGAYCWAFPSYIM
jgi:hypothetical protein